jgi:hypothetical protein
MRDWWFRMAVVAVDGDGDSGGDGGNGERWERWEMTEAAETVKETAGNGNGWWRNNVWWWLNVERKCLRDVSDMRGKTVSLWILFYYDSIQGFYTTLWVPYESVLCAYLQREWKDGHMKIKKRGIRGSKNKGNEENGYSQSTRAGPSLLSWADPSRITFFMLVFFS